MFRSRPQGGAGGWLSAPRVWAGPHSRSNMSRPYRARIAYRCLSAWPDGAQRLPQLPERKREGRGPAVAPPVAGRGATLQIPAVTR